MNKEKEFQQNIEKIEEIRDKYQKLLDLKERPRQLSGAIKDILNTTIHIKNHIAGRDEIKITNKAEKLAILNILATKIPGGEVARMLSLQKELDEIEIKMPKIKNDEKKEN